MNMVQKTNAATNDMAGRSVSAERREREKVEMRRRIMDAAREMFAQSGYEAVTLRGVANAIEYSPAAIYQYFPDKKSLIIEICLADYASLTEVLAECRTIENPLARLREMAWRYAEWGVTHPNHYKMLTVHLLRYGVDEIGDAGYVRYLPPEEDADYFLLSCVEEAMAAGLLKPRHTDGQLVAATMWAALHGVVSLEINMDAERRRSLGFVAAVFKTRVKAMLDVLLDGYFVADAH
jgi:AcrR family transcriptional regulator